MIIAKELRNKNIAEYLIYMFQVEDLIRAFQADMEKIYAVHIKHFDIPLKEKEETKHWYEVLCKMMKEENLLTNSGHLQFLKQKITELEGFHFRLLNANEMDTYFNLYQATLPYLTAFKEKNKQSSFRDVEAGLTGLYMLFLMRLKKQEIKPETQEAFDQFSRWLAELAKKFYEFEQGKNEFF
jgi:hypothetical protein